MRPLPFAAALLLGCTDKVTDDTATETHASIACDTSWSEVNGIAVDPITCLGWSSQSGAEMTWHDAVSAGETTSEDASATDYCADLSEGGRDDWQLPDVETLEDLSKRSPPLDPLDGHLWSASSDSVDDLAWTVELSNPGLALLLGKDDEVYVRCIAGG
jgi:hypothetical protein